MLISGYADHGDLCAVRAGAPPCGCGYSDAVEAVQDARAALEADRG